MGWSNLVDGARDLHNVVMSHVNVVNAIDTFVGPTPPTNIIKNETILNQYSIKQGLQIFWQKGEVAVQKELQQFHDSRFVNPNKPRNLTYEQLGNSLLYFLNQN